MPIPLAVLTVQAEQLQALVFLLTVGAAFAGVVGFLWAIRTENRVLRATLDGNTTALNALAVELKAMRDSHNELTKEVAHMRGELDAARARKAGG
jgi:hypothetical protein